MRFWKGTVSVLYATPAKKRDSHRRGSGLHRYTPLFARPFLLLLWLVGNPRSGILAGRGVIVAGGLWLVGNPRSGILGSAGVSTRHSAVVGRESPLRYTLLSFQEVNV